MDLESKDFSGVFARESDGFGGERPLRERTQGLDFDSMHDGEEILREWGCDATSLAAEKASLALLQHPDPPPKKNAPLVLHRFAEADHNTVSLQREFLSVVQRFLSGSGLLISHLG